MRDEALFHASLKVSSSAFSGIGLALIGETPLQKDLILLIVVPLIGIVCLGVAVYIERFLIITYD